MQENYYSIRTVTARYKINQNDINYICLSKAYEHNLHLHSADKISGVLNINSKMSLPANLSDRVTKAKLSYFSFASFERPAHTQVRSHEDMINRLYKKFEDKKIKFIEKYKFTIPAKRPLVKKTNISGTTGF